MDNGIQDKNRKINLKKEEESKTREGREERDTEDEMMRYKRDEGGEKVVRTDVALVFFQSENRVCSLLVTSSGRKELA